MKISLVTANLNTAHWLQKSVESVIAQSYTDWEIIIVDGMSSDASAEYAPRISAEFPDRIRLFSIPAEGVYEALNLGIREASGDIVGTLHANDMLASPDVLAEVARTFTENPASAIVYGDIYYINPDTLATVRRYRADRFTPDCLREGFAPPHPGLFVRRDTLLHAGGYDTRFRNAADFELIVRLFRAELPAIYLPRYIAAMTTGGASTRWKARLWRNRREKVIALRENGLRPSTRGMIMNLIRNFFN